MGQRSSLSRSKKSSISELEDSDLEGLTAPAPIQQNGGMQLPTAEIQADGAQITRPIVTGSGPGRTDHELSKLEIKDHLAMGGMSALALQQLLQTDVFMPAEVRSTYTSALHRDASASPSMPSPGLSGPAPGMESPNSPVLHVPHLSAESFGADGALAPQGVMSPQGMMTKIGMLGAVHGLMGIRAEPISSAAPQHTEKEPALAKTPAAASGDLHQNLQGQQHAGQSFTAVQGHFDGSQAFQPVPTGGGWFNQALWGSKNSPWFEVFNRIGALLLTLLGVGKKSAPPHKRGIHQ